ncbi:MAG: hypothetical protein KAI64_04375, partial [Thermoplasmata archaeon]|nr:hypothetical protein [Thermoplasmata archaeon]
IVIKDESGELEQEAESAKVERTLDGALTLDDAEVYLTKSDDNSTLLTPYELLTVVLTNIAGDEEKGTAIREVVRDFQNTLDARTAEAVISIERALGGETVSENTESAVERQVPPQFREDEEEERKRKRRPEEEMADEESEEEAPEDEMSDEESEDEGEGEKKKYKKDDEEEEDEEMKEKSMNHPLNDALINVRDAFDEALDVPGDPAMKMRGIQESVNNLGVEITAQIDKASASAPVDAGTITRAVKEAVAPLQAAVTALEAQVKAGSVEKSVSRVPSRRAIKMPAEQLPTSQPTVVRSASPTEDNPTPKIRDLARKSTIGFEKRARGG